MPTRRRRGWWYLLAVLVLLVLAVVFRQVIGRFVLHQALAALARAVHGRVTYERVVGDVFSNLRLENVCVTMNGDSVRAAAVTVKYELLPLLRGRVVLSEVVVERPEVTVSLERSASGPDSEQRSFPVLEIRHLEVSDGRFCLGQEVRLESVEARVAVNSAKREMRLSLMAAQTRLPRESVAVRELTGEFRLTPDSLSVDGFRIVASRSLWPGMQASVRLQGTARVALEPGGMGLQVENLRLELAGPAGRAAGPSQWPTGRFLARGSASFDSLDERVRLDYALESLQWRQVELPRLTGTAELQDSLVRLTMTGAESGFGGVELDASLNLRNSAVAGHVRLESIAVRRTGRVASDIRVRARLELAGVLRSLSSARSGGRDSARSSQVRGVTFSDSVAVFLQGSVTELGVDTVAAALLYTDGLLELQRLNIFGSVGRMEFTGQMRGGHSVVECRLEKFDLGLVELLWPQPGDSWGLGRSRSAAAVSGQNAAGSSVLTVSGRVSGRLHAMFLESRSAAVRRRRPQPLSVAATGSGDSARVRQAGSGFDGMARSRLPWSGAPDSWSMSGHLSGEGLRFGSLTAERWVVDMQIGGGRTLTGRVAVGAEELMVQGVELASAQLVWTEPEFDLRVERSDWRMTAHGEVEFARDGFGCTVMGLGFETETDTLSVVEPFALRFGHETLSVGEVRLNVADGQVRFSGRVGTGEPARQFVQLSGRNVNLRKLQKLLRLETEVWGSLDIDLCGEETLSLSFAGTDVEVPGVGLRLKRIEAAATATSEMLQVSHLRFVNQVDTTVIAGRVRLASPVDGVVQLLKGGARPADLDLSVELADPGVWILGFLHGTLDVREGLIYGQVRVRGTLEKPELDGRARVVQARIHVPAVSSDVERVNAEFTFQGDKIVLDKLSGESGNGTVLASGIADLGPGFLVDSVRYAITCNSASISPLSGVYALGSGDVVIAWGPGRPLELAGDVRIEEAVVTVGFGTPAAGPSSESDSFVYDLRVRADRGIWLRNRDADIELGVEMELRRTMEEQVYTGRLWSRQGNIYYLDHTLRVTRGEITFGNISELNPELDIVAELPVRQSRSRSDASYPERIVLSLTGTLEQPVFAFGSEPPVWDEAQVASYLSLNVPIDELGALNQKEAVTRMLSDRVLSYFQTRVAKRVRDFVALDYLEIESGLGNGGGAKVTVGKYIGRKLYVSYTQSFASEAQPAFAVEYYLDRRNELLAERSADGRYSMRYRLRLRY